MRKTSLTVTVLFLSATVICFNDCKKKDSQNFKSGKIIEKVTTWLESQKSNEKLLKNEKIQKLKDNLNFSGAYYEQFTDEEQFMIIPINTSFKSVNNNDKRPLNNLLLILDQLGNIKKGNIVQFIPANKQESNTVPKNTFYKIFNSKELNFDGRFAFLSINDWLLYELKYENGNVQSYGVVKYKPTTSGSESRTNQYECYAQYLITTVYYEDGTIEVSEEYLGTFCVCTWGTLCDELEGGGGSGGECCIPDPNIQLSSSSISESVAFDCGLVSIDPITGRETKTCTYSWYFNTNTLVAYTWKYMSIEQSFLEKVGGIWKFKSGGVAHQGMGIDGTIPPCVSFSCNINSAMPSISSDKIQARMDLIYTTNFNISCCPWCQPSSSTSSAHDNWFAQ